MTKKKRGRPKGPKSARRDLDLRVPVTKAEAAEIKQAAGSEPVAEFLRRLALAAARGDLDPWWRI